MLSLQNKHLYIIAHRGACAYVPENTIAAALLAYRFQADMWEMDVSLSKDGYPVVIHDNTLERTTNILQHPEFSHRNSFQVCDFTLSELKSLNAGLWFIQKDPFQQIAQNKIDTPTLELYSKNITIPTLEEALLFTKGKNWLINVEIKDHSDLCGHEYIVSTVIDCIQQLDMVEQVLLSSFQHTYLTEVYNKLPELATAVITDNAPNNPLELYKKFNAKFYHPNIKNLSQDTITPLLEEGITINAWTVNEFSDYQQALKYGVTGIITDFPEKFRQSSIETSDIVQ